MASCTDTLRHTLLDMPSSTQLWSMGGLTEGGRLTVRERAEDRLSKRGRKTDCPREGGRLTV